MEGQWLPPAVLPSLSATWAIRALSHTAPPLPPLSLMGMLVQASPYTSSFRGRQHSSEGCASGFLSHKWSFLNLGKQLGLYAFGAHQGVAKGPVAVPIMCNLLIGHLSLATCHFGMVILTLARFPEAPGWEGGHVDTTQSPIPETPTVGLRRRLLTNP